MIDESPIKMNDEYTFKLTEASLSNILQKVFLMMMGGLVITGIAAYLTVSVPAIFMFVYNSYWIWIIAELIVVMFLSFRITKMGSGTAITSFILYSIINGVTLSGIFIVYELGSIATTFLITAGMFGIAAFFGKITKMDLTKFGSFLMMGLIGIILASLVNLFLGNTMFDFWISVIGIAIFIGLTAYDVQKIKDFSTHMSGADEEVIKKLSVIGALELYLDFINIFLKLLTIIGNRRD